MSARTASLPTTTIDAADEAAATRVRGLSKSYGAVRALADLDLDVRPGQFLALLGPSGCGKTTLLRILGGFEQPDGGSVCVAGRDVTAVPPHKRDVNTVFQSYALFPHMSVADNVAYGLRQRGRPRTEVTQRVADALDMVRLSGLDRRRPAQLSGGQQQRVALARALVTRPSLLLLDEPLAALDRQLRQEMQVELKLLQKEVGITFLFVTHDQEEALSLADQVAVMRDGQVEQIGVPEEVYDTPATAFVAGFIGQQNTFTGIVTASGIIETARAVVRTADGAGPASGRTATAMVRPEHITVTPQRPDTDTNCLQGVVRSRSVLSDQVQYVVAAGDVAVVIRASRRGDAGHRTGDTVWCSWAVADVLSFPDQTPDTPDARGDASEPDHTTMGATR